MWNTWQKRTIAIACSAMEKKGYSKEQMYIDISAIAGRKIISRTDEHLNNHHFAAMLNHLKKIGWAPAPPASRDRGDDWMNEEQLERMRHLWNIASHAQDKTKALEEFLKCRYQVNDIQWIKKDRAGDIIDTIKIMAVRKAMVCLLNKSGMSGIIENSAFEVYRYVHAGFTHEELAAVIAAEMIVQNGFEKHFKNQINELEKLEFRKIK